MWKRKVCGAVKSDFTPVSPHLPDLSPVLQMNRADWGLPEIILAVDFPPSPCLGRKYWLHVCVFPGAAYFQFVHLR